MQAEAAGSNHGRAKAGTEASQSSKINIPKVGEKRLLGATGERARANHGAKVFKQRVKGIPREKEKGKQIASPVILVGERATKRETAPAPELILLRMMPRTCMTKKKKSPSWKDAGV